ncbi:unnamed protein product [Paramecium pentaurelia]|uniref:Uncharacterized protein n=1 Tax=Paramecium pentaurelia TaxID=43138 RepID=A0A8S1YIW9_9CILI|nr:unnamed protein product [Paramecium pentaurelia]
MRSLLLYASIIQLLQRIMIWNMAIQKRKQLECKLLKSVQSIACLAR